jgi:alcohol dehydrogenase
MRFNDKKGGSINMEMNFYSPSNLHFAKGALNALPEVIGKYGIERILFITDPGIVKVGFAERALALLDKAKISYLFIDSVTSDPSDELCERIYNQAKDSGCGLIVAMGGGSTLDAAKGANILFANPGPLSLYEGSNKVRRHGLPLIAIPTTAGTGSEADFIAVISNESAKRKMIISSLNNGADYALCDPELTLTLPPHLTIGPGMDALAHALEAYLSKGATMLSDIYALKAMSLIYGSLEECVKQGDNPEARSNVMLGSALAGIAMCNAGTGVCHATTAPIGAYFHVAHGDANAACLAEAMRFNAPIVPARMAEMGVAMGMGDKDSLTAEHVVEQIFRLREACHVRGLASFGVSIDKLDEQFITEVVQEFSATVNPREIKREDVIPFVQACL